MNIISNSWTNFNCFFSAEYCQRYLKNCYQTMDIHNPEAKSYENCYPFLYYLEHGQIYYQQAENSPLILKPILLFYGLVHLIKACILTVDPSYPESTAVLAHGVSTRKRKKQNYLFFHDEVKFQKNGLFPYMSEKLFKLKQLEGEKATMEELLQLIPELNELFLSHESKQTFEIVHTNGNEFYLSDAVLDFYHMTESRFMEFLSSKMNKSIEFFGEDEGEGIRFKLYNTEHSLIAPLKFSAAKNSWMFPLQKSKFMNFPELLIHYLLLYNLSMIARYETEWWSELVKMMPNRDYPFIYTFLQIAQYKNPFLVYQFLQRSDNKF
ncbi:YaaC family protein [Bacillus rubiinfantis]|uniref:YaaC family protein n=1 Tax=Bacillus rubiinfantis TaxID=1499680 RepID=UPI000A43A9EE|nr:YaaC family protein [Bacillus rubiinfantis]